MRKENTLARTTGVLATLLVLTAVASALVTGCSEVRKQKSARKEAVVRQRPETMTCPLCGLEVKDGVLISRRPVAVKISNDPRSRPQSGLDRACVVYEDKIEGGMTRFIAIYLCRDADQVGPIRSARPADIEITFPYYSLFAHCGGAPGTIKMIKSAGIFDLDEFEWEGAYWRSQDRRAPYNLYSSTERLRAAGESVYPFEGHVERPFSFLSARGINAMETSREDEKRRAGGAGTGTDNGYIPRVRLADNLLIPYPEDCDVRYSYDPATQRYIRFVDGAPHTDAVTGNQLAADTIIVQYVSEGVSVITDVYGVSSPDLGVVGTGRAQVFMMGQVIDAGWVKGSRSEHCRYLDGRGKEIRVKPGAVWVEMVSAAKEVVVE